MSKSAFLRSDMHGQSKYWLNPVTALTLPLAALHATI